MDERAKTMDTARNETPRPARTRRVPAYFTMYLINELLTTLKLRQKD
jgi:hypothetical protein